MPKIKIFFRFILILFLILIPAKCFAMEEIYGGEASVKINDTDVAKTFGSVLETDFQNLFSGATSISVNGNPVAKTIASLLQNSKFYLFSGDATLSIGGQTISTSSAKALLVAAIRIFGDIYFKNGFNGLGVSPLGIGVAAAGDKVSYLNPPVKFDDYSIALWQPGIDMKNAEMQTNIEKLTKEAIPWTGGGYYSGYFNLNPDPDQGGLNVQNTNIDPDDSDGKVWITDDRNALVLENVTVIGSGTIIINLPDYEPSWLRCSLTIRGDFHVNPGVEIGFIVKKGDVMLSAENDGVAELSGAYFVPNGTFYTNFRPGDGGRPLTFTGSIVAKDINIDKSRRTDSSGFSSTFNYDPHLITNPPAGFAKIIGYTWSDAP